MSYAYEQLKTFKLMELADRATPQMIRYGQLIAIILIHIMALAAPFTFTWAGLIMFVVMSYATACLGITLCFHRLLTHQSFRTYLPIKYLLTFFGCLALQGGPISWAAKHRLHHKESDDELDPHTPFVSFLWSHVFWLFYKHPEVGTYENYCRFAPDLHEDAGLRFFQRYFFHLYMLFLFATFGVGYAIGGMELALSLSVWGCLLRTVYVWHVTWLVNSATHIWGYRNYDTTDNSRNSWWVAFLAFGEGWHNNHHADQRSARHGHLWFEFDMTYWTITAMVMSGLAFDVVQPQYKRLEARSQRLKSTRS